jgi:hypothetical protein
VTLFVDEKFALSALEALSTKTPNPIMAVSAKCALKKKQSETVITRFTMTSSC